MRPNRILVLTLFSVFGAVFSSACHTDLTDPTVLAGSVRERLERGEELVITPSESAGSLTAQHKTSTGWKAGLVDLHIDAGELALSSTPDGVITVEHLAVELGTIELPSNLLGYDVQLTDIRLELAEPTLVVASWSSDDAARASVELELELSWSLSHHGTTSPLGAPRLPRVPVELVVDGDGRAVQAKLTARAPGELWSWAGLLRLEDLTLIVAARTPSSR